MNKRWSLYLALSIFAISCKNTCVKDTDCILPEVCISGSCINIYFKDGGIDFFEEYSEILDALDLDTNSDNQDLQETEGGPTNCEPELSQRRQILGEGNQSGEGEQPQVITLQDGSFYLMGRKYEPQDPDYTYKYVIVQVNNQGVLTGLPIYCLGGRNLPGYHNFFPLLEGGGMGILFKASLDVGLGDNLAYIRVDQQSNPPVEIKQILVTDSGSDEPYGVDNGENIFVVYKQTLDDPITGTTIESLFLDYQGENPRKGPTVWSTQDGFEYDSPVVSYSGESYLVAFYKHRGAMTSAEEGMILIELDKNGEWLGENEEINTFISQNVFAGRPSITWTGDRWVIVSQESPLPEDTSGRSIVHLSTKFPEGLVVDVDITNQWIEKSSGLITDFSRVQPGEFDIIWNGNSLGILLKHDGGTQGRKTFFAEFDINRNQLGDVIDVFPGATGTYFPSLTYMENASQKYYLFACLASSTGVYNIMVSTYGCSF